MCEMIHEEEMPKSQELWEQDLEERWQAKELLKSTCDGPCRSKSPYLITTARVLRRRCRCGLRSRARAASAPRRSKGFLEIGSGAYRGWT
jgi:hypothetical protein